jgi:hypothetical protein
MGTLIPFIGYHGFGRKVKDMNKTEWKLPAREGRCEQEKEQDQEQLFSAIARIQDGKALRCLRTLARRMARRETT